MNPAAIEVRGLSKVYPRMRYVGPPSTLRQDLMALPGAWFARLPRRNRVESFHALDDVSFNVATGEVFGVIGRNGAGKSTLLKVLSRITAPSAGNADLFGRVGSLLEVGTGFHPELTGRENIFLSGAILGLRRAEVRRRFDKIVEFAGVERFLETPCKHYSSGMYMRLAFAVAAHLDVEILLIDEVLAVGDAEFQKKCLGKMTEVASGGRTVLFVSHNMAAVRQLCTRGLVLERGKVAFCGAIDAAISAYRMQFEQTGNGTYIRNGTAGGPAWIAAARLRGGSERAAGCVGMSESAEVLVDVHTESRRRLAMSLQVREFGHAPLVHCPSVDAGEVIPAEPGQHRVRITVPPLYLYPGVYAIRLALTEAGGGAFDVVDVVDELTLTVEQDAGVCTRPLSRDAGVIFVRPRWEYVGRK